MSLYREYRKGVGSLSGYHAYGGYSVDPELGLVIAGGRGPKYYWDHADHVTGDDVISKLPDVPISITKNCLVSIGNGSVVVLSGYSSTKKKAYMFTKGTTLGHILLEYCLIFVLLYPARMTTLTLSTLATQLLVIEMGRVWCVVW